jgi:hypothetical protein
LSNVGIKDIFSSSREGYLIMNIHTPINKNVSSSSTSPFIKINIPRALLSKINSVKSTTIGEGVQASAIPMRFTFDGNSSSPYNTISIHLRSGTQYSQLLIAHKQQQASTPPQVKIKQR